MPACKRVENDVISGNSRRDAYLARGARREARGDLTSASLPIDECINYIVVVSNVR